MSQQNKLAGKLVKILGALGGIEKKGYNSHQKYYYMREVDVLEALKAQLIAEKIIMLTSSEFVDIQRKEGKDKTDFVTTVKTTHTFIDSETGEQLSINSVGSGYDSSDKGASKAITAAVKYAIMKTFMLSDEGADIENDGKTVAAPVTTPKITVAKVETKTEATKNETVVQVVGPDKTGKLISTPIVTSGPKNDTSQITSKFTAPTISVPVATTATGPVLGKRKAAKQEPSFP